MTNSAAIRTMLESLNPARASFTLMMPVNGITAIMINATASMRGRPTMNIAIAAASRTRTTTRSVVMVGPPGV